LNIKKSLAGTLDLFEDILGGSSPDERFGMFVVMIHVVVDGGDQFHYVAKHTSPKTIYSEVSEEALHHIEPGGAGGCEVKVEPWMTFQPALDGGMLVGGIVIHDQV
jgi:hypothetical protein